MLFIFSLLLLSGCSVTPSSTGKTIDLFDTVLFLDKEFSETTIERTVEKTIRYNDENQVLNLPQYNLSKDIEILKQANINNPNWTDKYRVDTTSVNDIEKDITYTAVDPKLQIKTMVVRQTEGQVSQFESYQERDALISTSTKRIRYQSGEGYSITTTSRNLLSAEKTIVVEVRFKSN